MKLRSLIALACLLQASMPANADAEPAGPATPPPPAAGTETAAEPVQSGRLTITRFEVLGNSLLAQALVDATLQPFTGEGRGYGDIQRGLEALEAKYREHGYSTVQVYVPEQEVKDGVVQLKVTEAVIGKVMFRGQQHHDDANLAASLPSLVPGKAPNARALSENIQLANQNPAKNLDVVLSLSDTEGEIDAKVAVTDDVPRKVLFSADNTGNESTGRWRTGVGYRHANVFNLDHELTFNYTTSPGYYGQVKQYTLSYRVPLYALGDSVDFVAAKSDVSSGTSQIVGGGTLGFSGSGNIYGLHYNRNFARRGEYTSSLMAGVDWRGYRNDCTLEIGGNPSDCGSSGADVTVHPVIVAYTGSLTSPGQQVSVNASYARNIPGGHYGDDEDFAAARPNAADPKDGADAHFGVLKLRMDYLKVLPSNWQAHASFSGQYASEPLVSGEQFGLAGSGAVRGFNERAESRDRGYVVNAEIYTPELAGVLGMQQGSLRAIAFIDHARGEQVTMRGETDDARVSLASAGLGLRYALGSDISLRLDAARVIDAAGGEGDGDWRAHFSFNFGW